MRESELWEKIRNFSKWKWNRIETGTESGFFDCIATTFEGLSHFCELKTDELELRAKQGAWAQTCLPHRKDVLWMFCFEEGTGKFDLFHLKDGRVSTAREDHTSWFKGKDPWPKHIKRLEDTMEELYNERYWKK